jgi:hypothetical protein
LTAPEGRKFPNPTASLKRLKFETVAVKSKRAEKKRWSGGETGEENRVERRFSTGF